MNRRDWEGMLVGIACALSCLNGHVGLCFQGDRQCCPDGTQASSYGSCLGLGAVTGSSEGFMCWGD